MKYTYFVLVGVLFYVTFFTGLIITHEERMTSARNVFIFLTILSFVFYIFVSITNNKYYGDVAKVEKEKTEKLNKIELLKQLYVEKRDNLVKLKNEIEGYNDRVLSLDLLQSYDSPIVNDDLKNVDNLNENFKNRIKKILQTSAERVIAGVEVDKNNAPVIETKDDYGVDIIGFKKPEFNESVEQKNIKENIEYNMSLIEDDTSRKYYLGKNYNMIKSKTISTKVTKINEIIKEKFLETVKATSVEERLMKAEEYNKYVQSVRKGFTEALVNPNIKKIGEKLIQYEKDKEFLKLAAANIYEEKVAIKKIEDELIDKNILSNFNEAISSIKLRSTDRTSPSQTILSSLSDSDHAVSLLLPKNSVHLKPMPQKTALSETKTQQERVTDV